MHSYERSGTLHGLMRVRGFTQDDAHIFCLEEQLSDEIRKVLLLAKKILSRFGFNEFEVTLSTRPEKYVGSDEIWEKATNALKAAMESEVSAHTVVPLCISLMIYYCGLYRIGIIRSIKAEVRFMVQRLISK